MCGCKNRNGIYHQSGIVWLLKIPKNIQDNSRVNKFNQRSTMLVNSIAGLISFRDYMAWNNKTYYSSTKKRIGKEGDFYTSPYVHSAFGSALGRQVAQCWEILEKPKQFTIFEFGGGDGKLAYAILDFLEKNYSSCYKTIEYIISDYHDLSQHDNNRWKKVQPFNKNFISYPFIGMVLAHEFIDALPVHRIICKPDGLREIMVRRSVDPKKQLSGDITEEEIPLSTPILEKFFELPLDSRIICFLFFT